MITPQTMRRVCAGGVVIAAIVTLISLGGVLRNALLVRDAESQQRPALSVSSTAPWVDPSPVLRASVGGEAVQAKDLATAELEALGLTIASIQARQERVLGDGLRLIELDIAATGPMASGMAMLEWVAVNRHGVRMTSVTGAPDGDATAWTLVVQMVVA